MSQTISRLYSNHEHALGAVAELKRYGFVDEEIHVVGPQAGSTPEQVTEAIMKGYVLKAHARVYAQGVCHGGTLVTVHAPFGTSQRAIHTLESFHPIESGVSPARAPFIPWEDAAPLSSALLMPVLLGDDKSFSQFWNVPALTKGRASLSACVGLPELSSSSAVGDTSFGLPVLSSNPAPLSSMIGLPLLKR